jgi:hypothetical protein
MFADPLTERLAAFVRGVGIDVKPAVLDEPTLFPGLDIRFGAVLIDESRLIQPGDILHEAGHIAVTDPAQRMEERLSPTGGEELSALAWSYAATRYLGLGAELVFYPGSFQGEAPALIENFADGRYIGVPLLQRYGMSIEPRLAAGRGVEPFPHMLRWLR